MLTSLKKAVCMLLAALIVMTGMTLTTMKTAEAKIIVHEPEADKKIPLYGNRNTMTTVRIEAGQEFHKTVIDGKETTLPYYLCIRILFNGRKLYYVRFAYASNRMIDFDLPITDIGTYTLECLIDYPIVDSSPDGDKYHYLYNNSEAFAKAKAEIVYNFESYHAEHIEDFIYTVDKEPTCTEPGSRSKHCQRCYGIIPGTEQVIPAHDHEWKTPKYKWSADYKKVKATAVCKYDSSHVLKETVKTHAKKNGSETVFTARFKKKVFKKQTGTILNCTVKGCEYQVGFDGNATLMAANKNAYTVSIPNSVTIDGKKYPVTEIAARVFRNSKHLTKVTIGKNVTKIGKGAFEGCAKLGSINIKTTKLAKTSFGSNCFKGIAKKAAIKCPKDKLKNYQKWMKNPGGAPKTAKWKK